MRVFLLALSLCITATICAGALAGSLPSERLRDPALEARAEHLFSRLRCLVCQNETIADSDARIAQDLRLMVRTRLKQGQSDAQVMDFIHSRYGDFVLLKPPFKPETIVLWFGPFFVLAAGVVLAARTVRKGAA